MSTRAEPVQTPARFTWRSECEWQRFSDEDEGKHAYLVHRETGEVIVKCLPTDARTYLLEVYGEVVGEFRSLTKIINRAEAMMDQTGCREFHPSKSPDKITVILEQVFGVVGKLFPGMFPFPGNPFPAEPAEDPLTPYSPPSIEAMLKAQSQQKLLSTLVIAVNWEERRIDHVRLEGRITPDLLREALTNQCAVVDLMTGSVFTGNEHLKIIRRDVQ